jgi:hypothetical protein
VRPSNHSRRIAFFVVVAYGENLKSTRTVVWNQLLARMGIVETQRSAVPCGAAFSLNLPIAVATPKLANTLTVYVKNTRRDAHSHLGSPAAVQSSPWSQVRPMMFYNCALCTVRRDEAQLTLHVTEPVPLSNSLGFATVYSKNSRLSGVDVSLALLQILPTMPYDVRLNVSTYSTIGVRR